MTHRPLEGQIALVTGGSRGLGAATCRRLARMGARVVVGYRSREDEAAQVVADCNEHTPGARLEQVDLIEEDSVRALFDRVTATDGELDIVVANAAATALKPLLDIKMHQFDKTFAISVRHFLLMSQLAFPLLKPRGGRIIAISGADTAAYIPAHGLLAGAKAAMETFVQYLGVELAPHGVSCVGVLPGFIDTDSIKLMAGPFHEKLIQAELQTHPMREAATPDDASEAIALMCLPEARWLNGQTITNDGGGIFAYMGRFSQAWLMQPDNAVMPDTSEAPMVDG